jgi:hypothetical protein
MPLPARTIANSKSLWKFHFLVLVYVQHAI